MVQADQIRQILVAGAGTMGRQIALQCALHGYDVSLYDINAEVVEASAGGIDEHAGQLVEQGRFDQSAMNAAVQRISFDPLPCEAVGAADIVIEAVAEGPAIKAALFAKLNKLAPSRTIFVTNTSSLRPSKIAKGTGRPDRFAAFHFHIPVWDANVVDIMPHPGTSPETIGVLTDFARRIDQIPIVMRKEEKGYVFNTMLNGILRSSLHLAASGIATIEDVDRSWMAIMGMPVGPFGIMDRIGIDLVYHIALRSSRFVRFIPRVSRVLSFLKEYVESGRLGIKSGEGFYTYPDPAFRNEGFLAPRRRD